MTTTLRHSMTHNAAVAAGPPRDIVVLDDDEDSRRFVARALQNAGHTVVEIADAESFFEYLGGAALRGQGAMPGLVVADVNLLGMSGVDLVENLRQVRWDTPVLFISADRDMDQRKRAGSLPGSTFLAKPFSMNAISRCVDELLGRA